MRRQGTPAPPYSSLVPHMLPGSSPPLSVYAWHHRRCVAAAAHYHPTCPPVTPRHPCRVLGPPSLKVIAAAALQALLAQQLATMEAQVQGGGGTGLSACQPPEPLPDHTAPAAARSPTACSAMQAGTPAVLVTLQEIVIPTHVATPTAASPHGKRCTDTPVGASGGGTAGLHACPVPRTHSSGWYEEKCCVCWEADVDVAMRPCTHALCLMCARQLVDSSGTTGTTCPLCRCLIGDFRLLLPPDAHGGSASGGSASGGSASVGGSCTRLLTCTAGL